MKQNKDIRLTVRLTQEQYDSIQSRANAAQMTASAYVRAAAMRHKIVVVDGLPEITRELKGIGRNLNQLAILANMGRISEVRLGDTLTELDQLYQALNALSAREQR